LNQALIRVIEQVGGVQHTKAKSSLFDLPQTNASLGAKVAVARLLSLGFGIWDLGFWI